MKEDGLQQSDLNIHQLYKKARLTQFEENIDSSVVDVDALVEEVLRENIEDFDIRSAPFYAHDEYHEVLIKQNSPKNEETVEEDFNIYYSDSASELLSSVTTTDNVTGGGGGGEEEDMEAYDDQLQNEIEGNPQDQEGDGDFCGSTDTEASQYSYKGEGENLVLASEPDDDSSPLSFTEERIEYSNLKGQLDNDKVDEPVAKASVLLLSPSELTKDIMALGPNLFVERQIEDGQSPSFLLESLGYSVPDGLLYADTSSKWDYVKRFLLKFVYERPRLNISSMEHVLNAIQNAKSILIITGAGISVSCGIPDFRSEDGLYSRIQEKYSLPEPECMFDIEFFRVDPEPFYSFSKELLPNEAFKPSFSHQFIRHLEQKGKLLRQFTQNIDTLEDAAGIERVLYCHGSFATASCLECDNKLYLEDLREAMNEELVPLCKLCAGLIKPDIVFFGEPLPKSFHHHLTSDCKETDLVLVIGSSLKVHPVSNIPGISLPYPLNFLFDPLDLIPPYVPQILINRESLDHNFDIELLGDCDIILSYLFLQLGWSFDQVDTPIDVQERFKTLLPAEKVTLPRFVAPNYHLFPGAKHFSEPPKIPNSSLLNSKDLLERKEPSSNEEEGEDDLITGGSVELPADSVELPGFPQSTLPFSNHHSLN